MLVDETGQPATDPDLTPLPSGNPGANLKSISHICHPILVAVVWELTKEAINFPLGCLQGGSGWRGYFDETGQPATDPDLTPSREAGRV